MLGEWNWSEAEIPQIAKRSNLHFEVAPYLEDIKDILKNPLKITDYELDSSVKYYYKYFKERDTAKYLLVIVKYLNNHGFIITAHFVRNIK